MLFFYNNQYYYIEPYTYWRIRHILELELNLDLVPIIEYKGNRNGKPKKYNLVDKNTGTVVCENCTLDVIRLVLTQHNYPLHADTNYEQDDKCEDFYEGL